MGPFVDSKNSVGSLKYLNGLHYISFLVFFFLEGRLFKGLAISRDSYFIGLPWWLSGKKSACIAGDPGLIPGLGRSPGGGHGNPLQYSCLEKSMDRGAL